VGEIDHSVFASNGFPRIFARLDPTLVPAGDMSQAFPILYGSSSSVVTNTPGFGQIVDGKIRVAHAGVYLTCVKLYYNGGTIDANGYAEVLLSAPGVNTTYSTRVDTAKIGATPVSICGSLAMQSGEAVSVYARNYNPSYNTSFWFDLPELQMTWIAPIASGTRLPLPGE
jgi:hypothetical protein